MNNNSKGTNWQLLSLAGVVLVIIGVLVILFLANGNTTVTNGEGNVEAAQSLVCEGDNISYPFFSYDNSNSKSIKVSAVFYDDKLSEISLVYRLSYDNNAQVKESEANNHASLGTRFGEDSLGVDALGVNFSILDKVMQMSLFARANNISSVESKYFLIEDVNGVYKIDNLAKIYTSKGLDCISRR